MLQTRSIDANFSGVMPQDYQLANEIKNNPNIVATLNNITINGDNVEFLFDSNLGAGEIAELDNVISNHVPDYSKPKIQSFNVKPTTETASFESYYLISKFKYQGSMFVGDIDYIDVISRIESSVATYDIKVVKFPNMEKIAEITGLSNKVSETNDLGIITNIPENPAILEVYVKQVGGSSKDLVYIDEIIVYYGN